MEENNILITNSFDFDNIEKASNNGKFSFSLFLSLIFFSNLYFTIKTNLLNIFYKVIEKIFIKIISLIAILQKFIQIFKNNCLNLIKIKETIQKNDSDSLECSICMKEIEDSIETSCFHYFCGIFLILN